MLQCSVRIGSRSEKWGRHRCRPHSHRRWSPLGERLTPGVSPVVRSGDRSAGYVARRSRRCRIVRWPGVVTRTCPLPLFDPRPVGWSAVSSGCASIRRLVRVHRQRAMSGLSNVRSLRGIGGWRAVFRRTVRSSFLLRKRLAVASIASRYLFRDRQAIRGKVRLHFRCLEDARRDRVGQGRTLRLIHFGHNCQWRRVDKSTARRIRPKYYSPAVFESPGGKLFAVAFCQQPQTQGVELDESGGVLLVISSCVVLEGHVRF